jgi:uncharacterized membrane protein (UPF0127 family)
MPVVRNRTRESVLADAAEIADTSAKRRKGLLGREALNPGQGLWIVPCGAIHTFFMRFPIDVVYLDRKKRVKKIRTGVAPWRLSGCLIAHSVLELPAGTISRSGTERGDQLDFEF